MSSVFSAWQPLQQLQTSPPFWECRAAPELLLTGRDIECLFRPDPTSVVLTVACPSQLYVGLLRLRTVASKCSCQERVQSCDENSRDVRRLLAGHFQSKYFSQRFLHSARLS